MKWLSEYYKFRDCIPLCSLFDTNSWFNLKKKILKTKVPYCYGTKSINFHPNETRSATKVANYWWPSPYSFFIDPFPKRHRLVHNGGFPKFEALYCRINMVNSTEIS